MTPPLKFLGLMQVIFSLCLYFKKASLAISVNNSLLLLLKSLYRELFIVMQPPGHLGEGGGYLEKFNTGILRPGSRPLTLLYTKFSPEKMPILYT